MLLMVPFLPWYNNGLNPQTRFLFSQVSMVWLLENGFPIILALYLTGVVAAIVLVAVERRPVVVQGVLPVVFPLWLLTVLLIQSYLFNYQGYAEVLTPGMFGALTGSVLLEASYFYYRIKRSADEVSGRGVTQDIL